MAPTRTAVSWWAFVAFQLLLNVDLYETWESAKKPAHVRPSDGLVAPSLSRLSLGLSNASAEEVVMDGSSSKKHLSELSWIPEDVVRCYTDWDLQREARKYPASLTSLVAVLRKLEAHPTIRRWDSGKLAATLIHKFRFDGLHYDRCVDTSTGALPLKLDTEAEYPKMLLIWQLVDGKRDDFPEDAISGPEKCFLHWTLSYSVNTTFRDDEYWSLSTDNLRQRMAQPGNRLPDLKLDPLHGPSNPAPDESFAPPSPYRNDHDFQHPFPYDCDRNHPQSLAPSEGGVVWDVNGPLTAGSVLTGIAAALRPKGSVIWLPEDYSTSSYRHHLWSATLAGDLAQTALLRRKGKPFVGPGGAFNSSLCPPKLVLKEYWYSHLTEAEINGDLDGLLLGVALSEGAQHSSSRSSLSQILDAYYNKDYYYHYDPSKPNSDKAPLSSMYRYINFRTAFGPQRGEGGNNDLLETEAYLFGAAYREKVGTFFDDNALKASISLASQELLTRLEVLEKDQRLLLQSVPVSDRSPFSGIADVGALLDRAVYTPEDLQYQREVAAALALELDIWSTEIKGPGSEALLLEAGSHLEVFDGTEDGLPFVMPSSNENKGKLACEILGHPVTHQEMDVASALTKAASLLASKRASDLENGVSMGRAQVVVLFSFFRILTSDRPKLLKAVRWLKLHDPDLRILIATRWAPPAEFLGLVENVANDVVVLEDTNRPDLAARDAKKLADKIVALPGQLSFATADPCTSRSRDTVYLSDGAQRHFELHQRYFSQNQDYLTVTFDVRHNAADICWSRSRPDQKGRSEVCQGASPGGKVTFTFSEPCGKGQAGDRGCAPIFFRMAGKSAGNFNCEMSALNLGVGLPCRSPTDTEILTSRLGATCNAAASMPISPNLLYWWPVLLIFLTLT